MIKIHFRLPRLMVSQLGLAHELRLSYLLELSRGVDGLGGAD